MQKKKGKEKKERKENNKKVVDVCNAEINNKNEIRIKKNSLSEIISVSLFHSFHPSRSKQLS